MLNYDRIFKGIDVNKMLIIQKIAIFFTVGIF